MLVWRSYLASCPADDSRTCANAALYYWTVSTEGDGITSGFRPRFPGRSIGTARFTFGRYTPLIPLTLDHEACPIIRGFPPLFAPQRDLRRTQRGNRAQSISQHPFVESLHQHRRRLVANVPEAGHHARRSRVHESAHQTDQTLSLHIRSQRGPA